MLELDQAAKRLRVETVDNMSPNKRPVLTFNPPATGWPNSPSRTTNPVHSAADFALKLLPASATSSHVTGTPATEPTAGGVLSSPRSVSAVPRAPPTSGTIMVDSATLQAILADNQETRRQFNALAEDTRLDQLRARREREQMRGQISTLDKDVERLKAIEAWSRTRQQVTSFSLQRCSRKASMLIHEMVEQLAAFLAKDTRSVTLASLCETFSRYTDRYTDSKSSSQTAGSQPLDSRRSQEVLSRMISHSSRHPQSASGSMARIFQHSVSCRNAGAHIADHQLLVTRLALEMHDLQQQRFANCFESAKHAHDTETPLEAYRRIITSVKLIKEMVGQDWQALAHTASLDTSLPLPWERSEALPL